MKEKIGPKETLTVVFVNPENRCIPLTRNPLVRQSNQGKFMSEAVASWLDFFLLKFDELRHGRLVFSESEVLSQHAGYG